ncbi:hypothetical protein M885DRAFT_265913 [Pelagophyceae sp. CCMP2097]|nr:hypothetical protein M885DRAFT_265913 [Pelagophyceae sp. CCMP2097]
MDRAPAISALLGAHRAPLRLLFAALDARQRGALREEGGDDFTFFHGYFPQAPGGPSPLGWPAAARAAISKTVVLDAATAWGGGGYNARQRARGALPGGNVEGEGVVDWAGFLDFFVEWASPSGLRALLRDVARECCAVVAASAAPRLRAPWWLLHRGEAANERQRTISDDELRDVLCTAFHELRHAPQTPRAAGRGFLVE